MNNEEFYLNPNDVNRELFRTNLDLMSSEFVDGKIIRDDKLPFLMQSKKFVNSIAQARQDLGLTNDKPIYSEPSSSAIHRLMRAPSREKLIEIGIMTYSERVAKESQEIIDDATKAIGSADGTEEIASLERTIEDMVEGATGYIGYHDPEIRKQVLLRFTIESILKQFSLSDSWYLMVENIILNLEHTDDAYSVAKGSSIVIDNIDSNGDIILRIPTGSTRKKYSEAWQHIAPLLGNPQRKPKVDINRERDLSIVRDMDAGLKTANIARKYFPHITPITDAVSYVHKIYERKSVK